MRVWLDGRLVDPADARVSVLSHALHYGTAVFDGCRFYESASGKRALFRLTDHLARLEAAARAMFLELPFGRAELAEACRAVVRASGLARGYLRAFAFFGDGTMGLGATNPVRVAVAAWEAPAAHAPVALRVASFGHGAAWLPGAKIAGQYARAFLARREAQATGCDDALFLGADGTVAEATGANVFIVRGGAIETPPLGAPVLAGITRASVLALAGDAGIAAHERPVRRDDVIAADEAFLTSSSAEIVAVRSFEGRALRAPGRVTSLLAERLLSAATGRDDRHRDWLEHVE